jgi:hypothetical protein
MMIWGWGLVFNGLDRWTGRQTDRQDRLLSMDS